MAFFVASLFENEDDSFAVPKRNLLQSLGIPSSIEIPLDTLDSSQGQIVLKALRVASLTPDEIYFWSNDDVNFVSARNESRSLVSLRRIVEKQANGDDTPGIVTELNKRLLELAERYLPMEDHVATENELGMKNGACLRWGETHGIRAPIEITDFASTGRGARSTRDIRCGEIAISVARDMLLNAETARKSGDFGDALRCIDGLDEGAEAMLFVIHEKGNPESVWAPWFALMPTDFGTALQFSENQLDKLQGSALYGQAQKELYELRECYDAMFPALSEALPEIFPSELFTWDNWLWARCLFDSRGMRLAFGEEQLTTLVPVADFLNHGVLGHCVDKQINGNQLEVLCHLPVKRGEQLRLFYGPFSNGELLLLFGFTMENNPYDYVGIDIDAEDLSSDAAKAIQKFDLSFNHKIRMDGRISPKLLATLRICLADSKLLKKVLNGSLDPLNGPLSKQNETAATSALENMLSSMLQMLNISGNNSNNKKKKSGAAAAAAMVEGSPMTSDKDRHIQNYLNTQAQILTANLKQLKRKG